MSKQKFNIGDKVCKATGYHFVGEVKAAYEVAPDQWRYDVQFAVIGMLHIFGDNLILIKQEDYDFCIIQMNKMCSHLDTIREGN